ncbi:MAG: copper resistance-related lipoprotein [Phycisphaerae bacterium]|nr:MAG: copper resistance-related lipoprotein [Phycisphaerae bacterium]
MLDMIIRLSLFAALMFAPIGCAIVDAHGDYLQAGNKVEHAIGQSPLADPEGDVNDADTVSKLVEGGLTADEAVQLALLNHPRARAVLLDVGLARADVVQAGLWTNPTLGLSFRLPEGGGLTNIEAGLAQNIANVWMIPARKRAAHRDLDRVILITARELVMLAIDTKVAYFNAVAADAAMPIARDNVELTDQLLRISEARLEAGTVGSLDVNLAKGQALKAQVDFRTTRLSASNARRTLATMLGLTMLADDLVLTDSLVSSMGHRLDVDHLVDIAMDARLDVRAAREATEASAARVELELAKVWKDVQIGIAFERNAARAQQERKLLADTVRSSIANGGLTAPSVQSRGQRRLERSQRIEAILGPSLSLSLPIFDQNQAQIAKARMGYLQNRAALDAIERSVVQETRGAVDRLTTAWGLATMFESDVLPQANRTLEISESTYQSGQATILNVIDAQRSLLETRRANVAALQSVAIASVELERATARPIRDLLGSQKPTTQDAANETTPAISAHLGTMEPVQE